MKLKNTIVGKAFGGINHIHFVGIGGVGMSGIAEVLLNMGYNISGSDLNENKITQKLTSLGANIFYSHKQENINNADVVVVSSAISKDNVEIIAANELRIPVVPRAQMLAEIMRFTFGIAIAGTHGKTTTTSLITSILATANLDPTYVVGGVLNGTNSNAKLGTGDYFVAEADESDASFLLMQPMLSVVTNIDDDHLSSYNNNFVNLTDSFVEFLHHLPFYGLGVLCIDDYYVKKIIPDVNRPVVTYGLDDNADYKAINIQQNDTSTSFTVVRTNLPNLDIKFNMRGIHNVQNALAAIAVASKLNIEDKYIVKALADFAGIARRLQHKGDFGLNKDITLFDDYGHHPREVKATISALKQSYPDRRLVMLFQPHRFSRTKALYDDFVRTLEEVDILLMLDVYSAGEKDIIGADSKSLSNSIRMRGKIDPIYIGNTTELYETLPRVLKAGDLILTQGAGDVSKVADELMTNYLPKL